LQGRGGRAAEPVVRGVTALPASRLQGDLDQTLAHPEAHRPKVDGFGNLDGSADALQQFEPTNLSQRNQRAGVRDDAHPASGGSAASAERRSSRNSSSVRSKYGTRCSYINL